MKIKILIIGLVAGISTLVLAGCSMVGAQQATVSPSVSAQASATASPSTVSPPINVNVGNQTGIWVNGQGTVMVAPNIANLNLGVSAQAAKVADAQSQAAAAMTRVISALTGMGSTRKISQRGF